MSSPDISVKQKMSRLQLSPNVSIINSLRSIGYSLDVSIADILDNSISANATEVHVNFDFFQNDFLKISIVDNGYGMNYEELKQAMTLGSKNPNASREKMDLGRFGLGLKTASFSQCKSLTVISKQGDHWYGLTMDLDQNERLQDWGVDRLLDKDIQQTYGYESLSLYDSGTLVVWQKCDRLLEDVSDIEKIKNSVYEKFSTLHNHLGLVFHRWLEPNPGYKKLSIFINNLLVQPVDPFARKHAATQELDGQYIYCNNHKIFIQAFTLPHHKKCTEKEYRENSLGDYMSTQGFYVYRNRRLLIGGDWFRLQAKKELTKLTRVLIDLPNDLDFEWKIDVKKSSVELPNEVRAQLKFFLERFCAPSKRTYTYKGRQPQGFTPIWKRYIDKNLYQYKLNEDHPIIASFCESLTADQRKKFKTILELIADFLPKSQIFSDMGENPHGNITSISQEEMLEILREYFCTIGGGMSKAQFIEVVRCIEPFDKLEELLIKRFLTEEV